MILHKFATPLRTAAAISTSQLQILREWKNTKGFGHFIARHFPGSPHVLTFPMPSFSYPGPGEGQKSLLSTSTNFWSVLPSGVGVVDSKAKSIDEDDTSAAEVDEPLSDSVEPELIDLSYDQEPNLALSTEDIREITGGDPELEKKVQLILMEHALLRQEGSRVPTVIRKKYWGELLGLRSRTQRIKFYSFLWKTEVKNLSDKRKREEARKKRLEEFGNLPPRNSFEDDPYGMEYGLSRNTFFLRLYDSKVNNIYSHRIISEMVHGTPVVIDCGYEDHMVLRESKNCASQLELLLSDNRVHPQPFNFVFCNANPNSNTITNLMKRIPILYNPEFALQITEKSYLDLYPRDKLIYLSPHAREEMTEYDDDTIYIIGALVDKTDPRPFSLAKAKKEGIRLQKLPLDTRVDWGLGNKNLTLNQMANIMLELRMTRDWDKALRFIPRRKLVGGRTESQPRIIKDYELLDQARRGFRGDVNQWDREKEMRSRHGYQNNGAQQGYQNSRSQQGYQNSRSQQGYQRNSRGQQTTNFTGKTIVTDY